MRYKLKTYSIWEYGQRVDSEGKPHQEDSIFPAYEQQKDSDRLFILCDGMGGHEAGEVASSTVCSAMSKSIFESVPDSEGDFSDENLKKAIEDAFNALDALPLGDVSAEKKMGTTMTFLKFHNKGCTIAHMGDSRVYHIRPGKGRDDTKILFKTNDHSLVNDLIKVGELTPEEAKQSKQKNIITRAMQPKMERHPKPDIYHTVDIKPGDYFYMCSDGMLEQMEDENLLFNFSEATGDDDNKVKILTQATSQNLDNHSAIIVHVIDVIDPLPVENVPVPPTVTKPAPIMAEIEDSQEKLSEEGDGHKDTEIKTDNNSDDYPADSKPQELKNDNVIRFNNSGSTGACNISKERKRRLVKYVFGAIVVILLAFGMFFVSSKLSKKNNPEPEKIENSQKPPQKTGKKPRVSTGQETPQQPPEKPNGNSEPDKPNSNIQSGSSSPSESSLPNRIQNAMSSQPSQTGNAGASVQNNSNNSSATLQTSSGINLNHVTQHDNDVVSSDQQVAADATNNRQKLKRK